MFADQVLESTTTAGLNDYALAGPAMGFRSFLEGLQADASVTYAVNNLAEGGTDFEVGLGTVQDSPPRIVRVQVLSSSNAGDPVDWPAGSKRIFAAPSAAALVGMLTHHAGPEAPAVPLRGMTWLDTSNAALYLLKQYDGQAWVILGSLDPASHHYRPYRDGVALPGPGIAAGDVPVLQAGGFLDQARVPLLAAATELTIDAGSITPTGHYHTVDTEADADADELSTIETTGLPEGFKLTLRAENAARVTTLNSAGNINLAAGDFALDGLVRRIELQVRGAGWDEVSRSALRRDVLSIREEQPNNVNGGTFTAGAWQTRGYNAVLVNDFGGVPLAGNQVTLQAGVYDLQARCVAYVVNQHQTRLHNMTDDVTLLLGTSEFARANSAQHQTASTLQGRFELTATKVLQIQHRCQTTRANNGFGINNNFGNVQVYAAADFWRVA